MTRFLIIGCLFVSLVFTTNTSAATEFDHSVDFELAKATLNLHKLEAADSAKVYQLLAVASASAKNKKKAALYVDEYIKRTADFSILDNDVFDSVKNANEFEGIVNRYLPKLNLLTFIYFYIALIGFFIAIILLINNKPEIVSKLLIVGFIAVHSLFILEYVFYYSNYRFKIPHTYLMASTGALLYGPLLYLYFKRITQNYQLKKIDILHFLPTVGLIIVLLPIYTLPILEKIKIQLGSSSLYDPKDLFYTVFFPKLASLMIYGFLISKLYFEQKKATKPNPDITIEFWKKGIYRMHIIYMVSYFVYGISVSEVFFDANQSFYHSQVIAMSLMVLYVSGMAYIQPKVFNLESYIYNDEELSSAKYQKSSLTEAYSLELKEKLMELLTEKKLYRDNSINLDILSDKLNTSRHNTSQIINEHFNENFYEFLNDFRIHEAKELLVVTNGHQMNITDILYEVGFNNKVSFNSAFKKRTGLTPSQFRTSISTK